MPAKTGNERRSVSQGSSFTPGRRMGPQMKTLIVEDDFISRMLIQKMLEDYGPSHVVVNGKEAVAAVQMAFDEIDPYDLICLDIMMPEMDGLQALKEIRAMEKSRSIKHRVKVIITTALADPDYVAEALQCCCDYYLAKPVYKLNLQDALRRVGLL